MATLSFYASLVQTAANGGTVSWSPSPNTELTSADGTAISANNTTLANANTHTVYGQKWYESSTGRPLFGYPLGTVQSVTARLVHRQNATFHPNAYSEIEVGGIRAWGTGQDYTTAGTARNSSGPTEPTPGSGWTTSDFLLDTNATELSKTNLGASGFTVGLQYRQPSVGFPNTTQVDLDQLLIVIVTDTPSGGRMRKKMLREVGGL